MQSSIYASLAELRLLVGMIGEKEGHNWWPTSFFSSSSKMFLEPIYPRTSVLAQYHGVLEASRRVHDERLNVGSFHLFRLPEEIEQDIHSLIRSSASSDVKPMLETDKTAALGKLSNLGSREEETVEGPILCGSVDDILSSNTLKKVASVYSQAFSHGVQAYPYFTGGH